MTARRDFLAFTAGAVAAKTVLPMAAKAKAQDPAPPSAHPDAVLLAMIAEANRLDREASAMTIDLLATDPNSSAIWDESNRMMARWRLLEATISATPAYSMEGVLEKALMARSCICLDINNEPEVDDRLNYSTFNDLHRLLTGSPKASNDASGLG